MDLLANEGEIIGRSSMWETAAIGPEQPDYLNAVIVIDTVLGPLPLLGVCHGVERAAGRIRRERWGPRELDLDILLYGDAEIVDDLLTVPHPRLRERRFVLAPLAEAWPGASIPALGSVESLLASVEDQEARLTPLPW